MVWPKPGVITQSYKNILGVKVLILVFLTWQFMFSPVYHEPVHHSVSGEYAQSKRSEKMKLQIFYPYATPKL